jgi:hypothetical protein
MCRVRRAQLAFEQTALDRYGGFVLPGSSRGNCGGGDDDYIGTKGRDGGGGGARQLIELLLLFRFFLEIDVRL